MGVSKIGVPQNGRCIMENPIKMDDLGVPLFSETSIYTYEYIYIYIMLYICPSLKRFFEQSYRCRMSTIGRFNSQRQGLIHLIHHHLAGLPFYPAGKGCGTVPRRVYPQHLSKISSTFGISL